MSAKRKANNREDVIQANHYISVVSQARRSGTISQARYNKLVSEAWFGVAHKDRYWLMKYNPYAIQSARNAIGKNEYMRNAQIYDRTKPEGTPKMGLGSFIKSVGGAIGSIGGAAIGGPVGSMFGGMFGGAIEQEHKERQQWERYKLMHGIQHDAQKEFAKKGLQWRVEDAKKAGIHPLAAIGAATHSANPAMIGTGDLSAHSSSLESMGQNLSRVMMKQKSKAESELLEIGLDNARVENKMKHLELKEAMKVANDTNNKSEAKTEQVFNSPDIRKTKSEVVSSIGGGTIQAGQNPAYRFHKVGKNKYTMTLSESMKQAVEDSPQEWQQQMNLLLNFKGKAPFKAPKGKVWDYNYVTGTVELKSERKGKVTKRKRKDNRGGWFSFGAGR